MLSSCSKGCCSESIKAGSLVPLAFLAANSPTDHSFHEGPADALLLQEKTHTKNSIQFNPAQEMKSTGAERDDRSRRGRDPSCQGIQTMRGARGCRGGTSWGSTVLGHPDHHTVHRGMHRRRIMGLNRTPPVDPTLPPRSACKVPRLESAIPSRCHPVYMLSPCQSSLILTNAAAEHLSSSCSGTMCVNLKLKFKSKSDWTWKMLHGLCFWFLKLPLSNTILKYIVLFFIVFPTKFNLFLISLYHLLSSWCMFDALIISALCCCVAKFLFGRLELRRALY